MKNKREIAKNISQLLKLFSLDVNGEGLKETPQRVARMYSELLEGYSQDTAKIFKIFSTYSCTDLITVTDIQFYSLCEHHLIPFFGQVSIGYIPNGKILGLSKFARLVNLYARRLQIQEKLTTQIADTIMKHLKPKGVVVFIEAEHLCMSMRGVNKPGAITRTLITKGDFSKNKTLIKNFFYQIKK